MNKDKCPQLVEPSSCQKEERTYHLFTFGCQMNEHDSEIIAATLENCGYARTEQPEQADIIILNTCAVRRKPEDKVASLLGRCRLWKTENPAIIIAMGGCMAQLPDYAASFARRFPFLNLIFGTHTLSRLPQLLKKARQADKTIIDRAGDERPREKLPVRRCRPFQAWLPIIYGCNNFCAYCVVPFARGREVSRPRDEIIAEARELARAGCLEVTLLGQNVNAYGRDWGSPDQFARLLGDMDEVEGLQRIRFMTSHPRDFSPAAVEAIAKGKKICEHLHLPVQSGSNLILQKMGRGYSVEAYLELLALVRQAVPGAAITSDIIVGFPGEEESDFSATLELLQEARLDNVFAFIYSSRPGTAASRLEDRVSREEKTRRLRRLNLMQQEISAEINSILEGQVVEVLGEGQSKSNPHRSSGRTRTNKLIHFPAEDFEAGRFAQVEITETGPWSMKGRLVND